MAVEDWKGKRKAESETTLMSYQGEERHILNRCIKVCGTPTNLSTVRVSGSDGVVGFVILVIEAAGFPSSAVTWSLKLARVGILFCSAVFQFSF